MMKADKSYVIFLIVAVIAAMAMFSDAIPVTLLLHLALTGASVYAGVNYIKSKGKTEEWDKHGVSAELGWRFARIQAIILLITAAAWPVGLLIAQFVSYDQGALLVIQALGLGLGCCLGFIPMQIADKQRRQNQK